MNWFEHVQFQAKLSPDEPAVIFPGGMATYGRLVECVDAAVQHVLLAGLNSGQIVALEVRHPLLHLVLILALHRCGIASLTLQTEHLTQQSKLKIDQLLSDRYQPPDSTFRPVLVSPDWLTPPPGVTPRAVTGFSDPDAVCRLVLSSGTTGVPKVVSVTERTLQYRVGKSATLMERGRYLTMMGFSTLGGYQTLMTALALGGAVCFAGAPEDVLQVMSLFHVTHLIAAPFQIRVLLETQAKNGLQFPALRQVFVAGSHISAALAAEVRQQLCPNLMCAYGSTELGIVAYGPAAVMRGIDGATGFLMPGETIEVIDDKSAVLPPGQDGVIRIKASHIDRYFVPTPEDANIFKDGWFYPGDTGHLTADGILVIAGRVDEVINKGGEKAAPEMIEEVLRMLPQIADAAAFAIPGRDQIWAAIVCKEPLKHETVLKFCRDKLAGIAPDRLIDLDKIPRNEMGKIIRDDMRKAIMRRISFSLMS